MAKIFKNFANENIVFRLMNPHVVSRLRSQKKMNVPPIKNVDIKKDRRWNQKFMTSQLLQGMMNGESVSEISNRIFVEIDRKSERGRTPQQRQDIIARNTRSSIRNAQTMVTGAENGGRIDSYRYLDDRGIIQKKVWMATADDRTRPSHIDLDGEEQDIDQEFSNGCMFPADPAGSPEEVWQCRCSMRTHIVGFRRSDGSISRINYQRSETIHDRQMREERHRRNG